MLIILYLILLFPQSGYLVFSMEFFGHLIRQYFAIYVLVCLSFCYLLPIFLTFLTIYLTISLFQKQKHKRYTEFYGQYRIYFFK